MTALAQSRNSGFRGDGPPRLINYGVAASTTCYAGGIAALNASGYLVPATGAATENIVGVFEDNVDNSAGANGALTAQVRAGVFKFVNSGANAITIAHLGEYCYAEDDQTVGSVKTDGCPCGVVVGVETDGVLVWIAPGLARPDQRDPQRGTLAIASGTGSVVAGITLTASSRIIVTAKGRPTGSTNFASYAVTARTAGAEGVAAFTVEALVAAGTIDSDAAGDVDWVIYD